MSEPRDGGQRPATLEALSEQLYERCLSEPARTFYQQDLLALKIIPSGNVNTLQRCIQRLLDHSLMTVLTQDNAPCWRAVSREEAAKLADMTSDERILYDYVQASHREGIWTKTLKARANMHQSVLQRCLKSLETKNLIKQIKSVKYPTRKMYMIASLTPSDDLTGGPWYTDNELDMDFIKEICRAVLRYIQDVSYQKRPSSKLKHKNNVSLRDTATNGETEVTLMPLLPWPANYRGYPTLRDITIWLNTSQIVSETLTEAHVSTLLDVLYYDGKVEKVMEGRAYRAIRPLGGMDSDVIVEGNPLTEAPCGKCPVFNLCEEGGPVSASSCEYFQEWLNL